MPSYQGRALAFKAISFQKRQWFMNICCICLCPIWMVLLSSALGTFLVDRIQRGIPIEEILECAKEPSLNAFHWPILDSSSPHITLLPKANVPGATMDFIKAVNYFTAELPRKGSPGAAWFARHQPCVLYFGQDYRTTVDGVYDRDPQVNGTKKRDSQVLVTYTLQPKGGWFDAILNASYVSHNHSRDGNKSFSEFVMAFTQLQMRQWALYNYDASIDSKLIGSLPKMTSISASSPVSQHILNSNTSFIPANASTGLFQTIEQRIYQDYSNASDIHYQIVPYFIPAPDNLDDALATALHHVIGRLKKIDKQILNYAIVDDASILNYFHRVATILFDMPFGAIQFEKLDHEQRDYKWMLQFGNDGQISRSGSYPSAGKRLLLQQAQLDNSLVRSHNLSSPLTTATITQSVRAFPELISTRLDFPVSGLIGRILFPFGVSFLLPIFIVVLVKEKQDCILIMMRMNGLKTRNYVLSQYITFYLLYWISSTVFLLAGYWQNMQLFTLTQSSVLFLAFSIWGHAQIALAFFASSLFNTSQLASIVGFLTVLCSVLINITLEDIYYYSDSIPTEFFLWPPFAFYRVLSVLNTSAYKVTRQPYTLDRIIPGDPVFTGLVFLIVETLFFLVLAFYLYQVVPSDFGIRRPWYFPIAGLIQCNKRLDPACDVQETEMDLEHNYMINDDDVRQERQRVYKQEYPQDTPLVMKEISKLYSARNGMSPKWAVRDISLAVEKGTVLGLLGPNGAGKTTLMNIMTGLHGATHGEALIAGYPLKTQSDQVYKHIGICPQMDILWDDLTVEEHVYFYARLKGIPPNKVASQVDQCLHKVRLEPFKNRLSKGLSGGEKRRLSIAIALIANPTVVFLDEPTTGLDPEIKRLIWNIIHDARSDKAIVLTTHSMEEAEALCQRIGIMSKGSLRCLGHPLRLKQKYGRGFKLFFNTLSHQTHQASIQVERLLPQGWKKLDCFTSHVSYEFQALPGIIPYVFKKMEAIQQQAGILDWGISQSTLEEVFMSLVSKEDVEG